MSKNGYLYLIRCREFIRLNENTYKFGKTAKEPHRRVASYPKDSELILLMAVNTSCHELEKELIALFKKEFTHRPEYGNEYFQGDPSIMCAIIFKAGGKYLPKNQSFSIFNYLPNPVTPFYWAYSTLWPTPVPEICPIQNVKKKRKRNSDSDDYIPPTLE